MEEPSKIEVLTKNIKEYINIRAEIIKLSAADKAATVLAMIMFGFIVALLALLSIIFGGQALGYYFSTLTGNIYSGFLIVTGLYLVIGFIFVSFREKLVINPIRNTIIRQLLSNEE